MEISKKLIAEGFGTFCLTFAVLASITHNVTLTTPVVAALVLGIFVYTVGNISGSHLNPAVTIGLYSIKKISANDAIAYIIAQFVGALLAMVIGRGFPATNLIVMNSWGVLFGEFLGTTILAFGISAVVLQKLDPTIKGVVIGASLLLGIVIALPFSNGILNPAVALGISSFSILYVIAPILGSIFGMQVMHYLLSDSSASEEKRERKNTK